MGSYGQVEFTRVENLEFRVYSDEEVKNISAVHITNDQSINELGHFAKDGLYDLRMGPMSSRERDRCTTCGQTGMYCQGHCGHIELALPVFNPLFYSVHTKLLKMICFNCLRFQADEIQVVQLKYQLKLLDQGYGQEAVELQDLVHHTLSHIAEAEEVATGVGDRTIKQTIKVMGTIKQVTRLEKKLKKYCDEVMKGKSSCPNASTSNIKSLQLDVLRHFFAQCKLKKQCRFCGSNLLKISLQNSRFMKSSYSGASVKTETEEKEEPEEESSPLIFQSQSYVTSEQARTLYRRCWEKEKELLQLIYPVLTSCKTQYPTDTFFLSTLLVIPPKYRPCNTQDDMTIEHETSALLKTVVQHNKSLKFLLTLVKGTVTALPQNLELLVSVLPGKTNMEKIQNVWYQIQGLVDNLFDADLNRMVQVTKKGIRQVIDKKFGLFRRNLMGKRVNFSARSVAAPDPFINVDEVGVPMDFATQLYYPVPVTQWNVEKLRQWVRNGPLVYPGAIMVEDEEGTKKRLSPTDETQRIAIAKKLLTPTESHVRKVNATKIVYRHLQNGDYVLMNRQPTLHRPSIQAHKARVMPKDRVLRMPYANCKAYNADFDGDELNMHFPQNELARSEAKHLVTTHNQYLTPKDGSPLAGLIQDCVVASVMLTMRGKFFCKEDYQQLLFNGLSDHTGRLKTLPPAIIKPQQLWSGKQVISTLLLNVIPENKAKPSFCFKTSVKVDLWQTAEARTWSAGGPPEKKREAMTDSEFLMRDGELVCGVIDKSAIGSTSHGLMHVCHELYGGEIASNLLTAINRLCVYYLKWCGHTISVKEFVAPARVNAKRRAALAALVKKAPSEVCKKLKIPEEGFKDYFERCHMSNNGKDMAAIDAAYTSALGPTTSEVTAENERGLFRRSLDNHMRMMVDTGAKGSKVNMNQMASLFGSVAIDGHRMPISITGKFLPSFQPYEANPRAGGYIPDRFMTGIKPQSYFYLCIVGRDSLQHTAVKTADSGYLQRCLIKHLEGINVKYDMTVRNSDGLVLQFAYGEDGLDVTRVPFLRNPDTLDVLVKNLSRLIDDRSLSIARSVGDKEAVQAYKKTLRKWHKKNKDKKHARQSGFLKFCKQTAPSLETSDDPSVNGRNNVSLQLQQLWYDLPPEKKEKYNKGCKKCPDPVNSIFSGASNLGVVSEALDALIDRYYEENYSRQMIQQQKLTQEEVFTTVHMKGLNSMVDPGEAVGALCAQALGEPLTQMTLNTFHFAGRDELNVTLGVPRMAEILRSAARNISTPIMEIPFLPHVTKSMAEALRLRLTEVSLAKVLHKLNVTSSLVRDNYGGIKKKLKIKLTFLPHAQYKHVCSINPSQVLAFVELHFITKHILKEIMKSFGKRTKLCTSATQQKNKEGEEEEDAGLDAAEETHRLKQVMKTRIKGWMSDDEDEPEDEEEGIGSDDGVAGSRLAKQKEQDYSENEESGVDEDGEDDVKREDVMEDEGIADTEDQPDQQEESTTMTPHKKKKRKSAVSVDELSYRRASLCAMDPWITDYLFDRENELWCEVTILVPVSGGSYDIHAIVRQQAECALIHYVPNIKRVFVVEKDDKLMLRTEGVNILKMFEWEHMLDVRRLYTNNIHQVAELYGIEAAQRSIIKEIKAVHSAYDIKVDFRHLTLLADYFTCEGVYKACSRQALSSCVSPLQKMSYETCTDFLKNSILRGEAEHMTSPSASVAVGQPVKLGTNSMHLLPVIKF